MERGVYSLLSINGIEEEFFLYSIYNTAPFIFIKYKINCI